MSPRLVLSLALALVAGACGDAASPGPADADRPAVRDAARSRTDVLPADAGPDAAPDAAPPECRLNSDCAPGLYCREGRCVFDCREARDCAPGERCENGQCRSGPECAVDPDCGAPARVCVHGACVAGCPTAGCGAGEVCDEATGRCRPEDCGGCDPGYECDPLARRCVLDDCGGCDPGQRCRGGACVPEDCGGACPRGQRCERITGRCIPEDCGVCPPGQRCVADTGQCVPEDCGGACRAGERCDVASGRCEPVASGALGDRCGQDADCDSGLCLRVNLGGRAESACATLCCAETQCPPGFGCWYSGGARYCVPGRFNLLGDGLTRNGRQPCGDNQCRSGMCELRRDGDRCLGACCVDADCEAIGGGACFFGEAGNSMRTWCDLPALIIGGGPGSPCGYGFGPVECASGVCLASGFADPPGFCAGLCCKNADCGGSQICAPIYGFHGPQGGVTSACVDLPRGAAPEGAACAAEAECDSGHCVEGRCAEPCCFDVDCRGGRRCLPRDGGEGVDVRVCWPAGAE